MSTFAELKTEYDALLTKALAETDPTQRQKYVDQLMALKQQMADSLHEEISKTSIEDQKKILIDELVRIQHDYSGVLQSSDKLETLRRLHEQIQPSFFGYYEMAFGVACVALVGLLLARG